MFSRLDRCIVHSTTFGRNNLACACGLAALAILEDEKLPRERRDPGRGSWERQLLELQKKHEIIKEVRVKGLMCAIEFAEPKSFGMKMGWKAVHAMDASLFPQLIVTPLLSKHRILSQVAANNVDMIKILPPLMIGRKEVDRFVTALDDVLDGLQKFPGPDLGDGERTSLKAMKTGAPKEEEAVGA